MFQKILAWLRDRINNMLNKGTISQAVNVDIAMSSEMVAALQSWRDMYTNQGAWLTTDVFSLGLPGAVASEIARAVTIEMEAEVSGSVRADFLNENMQRVLSRLRDETEVGCALGGMIIKPYPNGDKLAFNYVAADSFYPIDFDDDGKITSCIFVDTQTINNNYYTRLEFHQALGSDYQITNKAFKSTSKETLGAEIPLESVDAWAELEEEAMITGVDRPLFGYFRYPVSNNIDMDSPLGISCFAKAQTGKTNLIERADKLWSQFLWELDSAQRALYVDVLAFDRDSNDKPILPNKRLYKTLKQSGQIGKSEDLFEEWTPNIRQEEYLKSLDAILKRVEFNCGLAYGTLSDPQYVDKTATEIKSAKQRSYATVTDTQKSLKRCLDDLLYACDVWATIYNLAPRGTYEASYKFDDSIVTDSDARREQNRQDVDRKLLAKWEYRVQEYGETEEAAKAAIAEIDAESQASMDLFEIGNQVA